MRLPLIFAALAVLGTLPAYASELDANFLIKRKDKVIGFHKVEVSDTENGQRVETSIEMKVRFGPIPVFRYRHASVEEWRDGELVSLNSTTDRNGKDMFVRAARTDDGFMIDGTQYKGAAPEGALPSSYWNKALVEAATMINTQHGKILDIEVTPMGLTEAEHGAVAEEYKLVSSDLLHLWYDGPRWVGARFTVDGEELVYELVEDERDYARLDAFLD